MPVDRDFVHIDFKNLDNSFIRLYRESGEAALGNDGQQERQAARPAVSSESLTTSSSASKQKPAVKQSIDCMSDIVPQPQSSVSNQSTGSSVSESQSSSGIKAATGLSGKLVSRPIPPVVTSIECMSDLIPAPRITDNQSAHSGSSGVTDAQTRSSSSDQSGSSAPFARYTGPGAVTVMTGTDWTKDRGSDAEVPVIRNRTPSTQQRLIVTHPLSHTSSSVTRVESEEKSSTTTKAVIENRTTGKTGRVAVMDRAHALLTRVRHLLSSLSVYATCDCTSRPHTSSSS